MNKITLSPIYIIGISVRTTSQNGQEQKDIGLLWQTFFQNGILEKIPNRKSNAIYAIYTDYETDFTGPYTTVLGCSVHNLDSIPEGMVGHEIKAAHYLKTTASGDINAGFVSQEWQKIRQMPIARTYTSDFEEYLNPLQDPANASVNIYIAVP